MNNFLKLSETEQIRHINEAVFLLKMNIKIKIEYEKSVFFDN